MLNHPFRKILIAAVLLSFSLLTYAEEAKQAREYTQTEIIRLTLIAQEYESLPYSCAPGKACDQLSKRVERRVKEFMDYGYTDLQARQAVLKKMYLIAYYKGACQLLNVCVGEGHKQ